MSLDSTRISSEGHGDRRSQEENKKDFNVNVSLCHCYYHCKSNLSPPCLVPTAKIPSSKWDVQFLHSSTFTTQREQKPHFVCSRKEGKSTRTVLFCKCLRAQYWFIVPLMKHGAWTTERRMEIFCISVSKGLFQGSLGPMNFSRAS